MKSKHEYAWVCYARLQMWSGKLVRLTPLFWGVDAGMAFILNAIEAGTLPDDPSEFTAALKRTISSAARLHRSRGRALIAATSVDIAKPEYGAAAEARIEIDRVSKLTARQDKTILLDMGLGFTDREIAVRRQSTPGAIRTRISRMRYKIVSSASP